MKYLILILSILLFGSTLFSQHIRTDTKIDGVFDISNKDIHSEFYNDFFLKRRLTKDQREKLSYNTFGVFKRDSTIGFKIGYDFDLISENFEKSRGNSFRYWNHLRARFDFIINDKVDHFQFEEYILDLFDAEMSLSYLHIPRNLRGDQKLIHRRGYFEFKVSMKGISFDTYSHVRFKPHGNIWIRIFHDSRHYARPVVHRFIGLDCELEFNEKGYRQSTKSSITKDVYKGFSFVIGGKFDLVTMSPYAHFGIRLQMRNH